MGKSTNKRSLIERLRHKYRLVVINEDTFEQKATIRLSRINIYTLVVGLFFLLVSMITSVIAFTNVKYYLPGVGSLDIRSQLYQFEYEMDSMQQVILERDAWIQNIQYILSSNLDSAFYYGESHVHTETDSIDAMILSETNRDDTWREEIEANMEYSLYADMSVGEWGNSDHLPLLDFVNPVDGFVIEQYNKEKEHWGVDIAGKENEGVKSVLDGTVVSSGWTIETGYVIAIQHEHNLISFYKHNSSLLKKVGNFVQQGEVVALLGNSGEYSSGPHLHFELWHQGVPVNPQELLMLSELN